MHLSNYSIPTPLSKVEANTLAGLERAGRNIVTLDQLSESLGRRRAYELVRSLTKKRVFTRIGRGLYSVRPFRAHGHPWTISAPVAASHLLASEPHYLGGRWASWFHKLKRQVPGSRIDAFVTRWRPTRAIENARIHFHRTARAKLDTGVKKVVMESAEVHVSDYERTLLDALDHPSLLGSVADAVEQMERGIARANAKRLVAHAVQLSRPSTCQRVAVLLERQGASAQYGRAPRGSHLRDPLRPVALARSATRRSSSPQVASGGKRCRGPALTFLS